LLGPEGKLLAPVRSKKAVSMRSVLSIAAVICLSVIALTPGTPLDRARAAQAENPEAGRLEQVIPGHYVYSNGARLSGIIATNEGVVVIDSLSSEAMAKHERQLIADTIK